MSTPVNIKLYGFPTSPYVAKVAGYLVYKNLRYEFVGVNPLNFEQIMFTKQRQVPVLQIGSQWKKESDDIALWLDELFPKMPLLPENESDKAYILRLNNWVNHAVVPAMFRLIVDWPSIPIGLSNGWKLAQAVNHSVGIPRRVQLLWPVFVRKAGFIQRIIEPLDRSETLEHFQQRILNDFVENVGGGPFLGGRPEPSLADVSLYPLVLMGADLELRGDIPWASRPEVKAWLSWMNKFFQHPPLPNRINDNLPT